MKEYLVTLLKILLLMFHWKRFRSKFDSDIITKTNSWDVFEKFFDFQGEGGWSYIFRGELFMERGTKNLLNVGETSLL